MIHIACNIDKNYVKYCGVTLVSIFENNRDEQVIVHIIASGLSPEDENILQELARKYNNEVYFYAPDMELLKGFTIKKFSKRISLATYYRCILSDLLPKNIDKIIYLDCDIVVLGSLKPFYEMDLSGIGVAAVEDIGCNESERYEILQYPQEYSYFNAGVMLINLDYWRMHDMAKTCVDYYNKYPERILFNDQCLLNSVLHKDKKLISLCWNTQDGFYRNPKTIDADWRAKYADILKNPIILHYTNRKPWDYDSQHPLRKEYFKYLALTPWKNDIALKNPINILKRFFRLLPFYVGLRRAKYVNLDKI